MDMQRIVVVFPGQGSQKQGMGRDIAETNREAMELWRQAETAAKAPLRDIYWYGDESAMTQTQYLQPAMFAMTMNLWRALAAKVGRAGLPAAIAGHSLGELCALAAAEVLPLDVTLEIVALRGRLMAEADPQGRGAMAAIIRLNQTTVEEIVACAAANTGALLVVANYNAPTQIVISGEAAAVAACGPLAKERKGRSIPLDVNGAFHSPLMAEAATELARHLKRLLWATPTRPIYSNVTGTAATDPNRLRELLTVQMTAPVQWVRTIQSLYTDGMRHFLELSPKNIYSKLCAIILADTTDITTHFIPTLIALDALDTPTS
ncbi:Malonyl CoA-acyl carrier protein transacylase [Desulfovibrionales bacterium]